MTLLATPAARAEDRIVGLLDVRGDGVPDVVLARFAEAIEDGLASGEGLQPATLERMQQMLEDSSWSTACTAGPCLAEVRAQTHADLVVTAGLIATGQSYRFTITLLDATSGEVLTQVDEACPACTVDDVASQATMATMGLLNLGDTGGTPEPRSVALDPRVTVLERRVAGHARSLRRTGMLVVGVALLAAGAGLYFLENDRTNVAYPLFGAAGGLAAAGTTMLGLSLRF